MRQTFLFRFAGERVLVRIVDIKRVHDPDDVHMQLGALAPNIIDAIVPGWPDSLHAQPIWTVNMREPFRRGKVEAGIDIQRFEFGLADRTDEADVVLHASQDGTNTDVDASEVGPEHR